MSKKSQRDDEPRKITISTGDEPPEPNATLLAMLRDGERPRPGEPGTLAHRLGAEVQAFLAAQIRVAKFVRRAVKGTVTLTIAVVTGPDGSQGYAVETKAKGAKIPPGISMTFTDDDGELTGRPVEPLTEEMYRRESASKNPAEPMVGAAAKV